MQPPGGSVFPAARSAVYSLQSPRRPRLTPRPLGSNPKATDTMICALCLSDKPLANSHVIPETVYRPTYDAKHRAEEMSTKSRRFIQKGYREKLLCLECEGRLSKYEKYFADTWFGKNGLPEYVQGEGVVLKALDYRPFKLFHLSILWRGSVSRLRQFADVSLGKHEEIIRTAIINDDPGPELRYPFFAAVLVEEPSGKVRDELIVSPIAKRLRAHRVYFFTFAGCCWFYVVSGHPIEPHLRPFILRSSGQLRLRRWHWLDHKPYVQVVQAYFNSAGAR